MKKRIISLLLAVAMIFSMLPMTVFAEDDDQTTYELALADCTVIGDSDGDAVYLAELALDSNVQNIAFTDFEGNMSDGMIASLAFDYVEGTHIAPLNAAYVIEEAYSGWDLEEEYEDYDFSGCYAYWIIDDDFNMCYIVVKNTNGAANDDYVSAPVVKVDGVEITEYTVTENGASYVGFSGVQTVGDLYTFTVPAGTETVDLEFTMHCLPYNYKEANNDDSGSDSNWLAGIYDDIYTGITECTVSLDSNNDGVIDFIQVQTPYDATWNTSLIYTITFQYAEETPAPVVKVDGTVIEDCTVEEDAYSYTNYFGVKSTVKLYTFTLPYGTETVDLEFGRNVLAYNYKTTNNTDDDYLTGMIDDYMTGITGGTFEVDSNDDGVADYIQVQTPFDSAWNTELLYAIGFEIEDDPNAVPAPVVKVDGVAVEECTVEEDAYSYTNYFGVKSTVKLYTFTLPYGTETVYLEFGRNVLAYNYKTTDNTDDDYLAGMIDDYMTGITGGTFEVDSNDDGVADYIQVQTPYDSAWNTELLYAIGLKFEEPPVDIDTMVHEGITGAQYYLDQAATEESYVFGDEWVVFALTRSGDPIDDAALNRYLTSVKEAYTGPKKSSLKPTTLARVALTLTALGKDASNLDGIDFIDMLCTSTMIPDASNEAMWALIALDTADYAVPSGAAWTREALIAEILSYQNPATGGFGLLDNTTDSVDMTAMIIQSLAPYYVDHEDVKTAVDLGLAYLKNAMDENCDYGTSESADQVIVALTALGMDPLDEANGFAKSLQCNVITDVCGYQNKETGAFRHLAGKEDNTLATIQGLYALEAYRRFVAGENRLYDMTDVEREVVLPFVDVKETAWYYDAVAFVFENGLMNGVDSTHFVPNGTVTRAMVARVLYNQAGMPEVTGTSPFTDVKDSAWYADAIKWASANGYVNGYGNGKFGPNDNVTREQMAVMLYRQAGCPEVSGDLSEFKDGTSVHDWAVDAMIWAVSTGVMQGKGNNTLDPRAGATRAELATVLMNRFAN